MPDNAVSIKVTGIEEIQAAMKKFPAEVKHGMEQAGKESSVVILETRGLQNYPFKTAANNPPAPYYRRGMGMYYSRSKKSKTSETLGKQWNVAVNGYKTTIGNRASYAGWVHGDEQAKGMSKNATIPKGWRKLTEVAKEKTKKITQIYNAWVDKTLKEIGLK